MMFRNLRQLYHQVRLQTTSAGRLDLAGIYSPITAPFDHNGNVAYDKLEQNLSSWMKSNLKGFLVHGSTGEFVLLSPEERLAMIRAAKKSVGSNKQIIGGSGAESTVATIEMTKKMAEAGVDAVIVVTPSFFKGAMTIPALIKHYSAVADASPVPVILYSVPSNTGVDLPAAAVKELSSHSNIIGMKDSGGDISKIGLMVRLTEGQNFQMLAGSINFLLPSLAVGCVGGVCAFANIISEPLCDLLRSYQTGNLEKALAIHKTLIEPADGIKNSGIAGVKRAMEWFGHYGGPLRPPLQPLPDSQAEKLKEIFVRNGWLKQ